MRQQFAITALIALGSAIGGVLRYWCSGLVARQVGETFPWGTIFVNVVGSLLIGFFAAVTAPDGRVLIGALTRHFFLLGLFGGFTTFSSFSLQTMRLVEDGQIAFAAGNVAGSVALCLGGVWAGHTLGVLYNQ